MNNKIEILDSTLRDGVQGINIDYSISDKLNIIQALDNIGVDFIEAGNPSASDKELEFFARPLPLKLNHSKLVAFGATRRKDINVQDDENIQKLLVSNADYISIFGKCSPFHVQEVLGTSLKENLSMISETISYLTQYGKEVFFDAEHFFDSYKLDPQYATRVLTTAISSGATRLILCDTNGGCFPHEISEITQIIAKSTDIPIGIHCHNDTGCAVANSLAGVRAGCVQIQGTFCGIGERCGNADLSVLIPNLQIKLGYQCISDKQLSTITRITTQISELSNLITLENTPYVGKSAFSHKAGMHIDAVIKNPTSFEHISPHLVGNHRDILLSSVSGRAAILLKLKKIAPDLHKESIEVIQILHLIKQQEAKGFQYEAAEASLELLIKNYLGNLCNYFIIESFSTFTEKLAYNKQTSNATVKVRVCNKIKEVTVNGIGPVNALDKALRTALKSFYPELDKMHLMDYKVRVVNSCAGTDAIVKVLIESTDGISSWTTVSASQDIICASVSALSDSIIYFLMRNNTNIKEDVSNGNEHDTKDFGS